MTDTQCGIGQRELTSTKPCLDVRAGDQGTLENLTDLVTTCHRERRLTVLAPLGRVRTTGKEPEDGLSLVSFRGGVKRRVAIVALRIEPSTLLHQELAGGHVAIAVYENIQERRLHRRRYFADVSRLLPLTYVVVLLLGMLFVSSLYLDVVNPIGG